MSDVGILFSSPMMLALLERRKSETRRLRTSIKAGDSLWVREAFACVDIEGFVDRKPSDAVGVQYRCDLEACLVDDDGTDKHWLSPATTGPPMWRKPTRWRPSIFLPRWASRVGLRALSVHVEPLQAISDEDCVAEGAMFMPAVGGTLRATYAAGFDELNGAGAWNRNPDVHVIRFEVTRIDRRIES